jgi:hypothetical protein
MCGYLTKRDQETRRNETSREKKEEKKEGKKGGEKEEGVKTPIVGSMGRGEEHEPCGVHGGSQWAGAAAGAGRRRPRWVGG